MAWQTVQTQIRLLLKEEQSDWSLCYLPRFLCPKSYNFCNIHIKMEQLGFTRFAMEYKRCRWHGKQYRLRSDCSSKRSSLIGVCAICPDFSVPSLTIFATFTSKWNSWVLQGLQWSIKDVDGMANSTDSDQTAPLIGVCAICPDFSVPSLTIFATVTFKHVLQCLFVVWLK